MKDLLLEFTEIIDEEIVAYEELSELYGQKQDILIESQQDKLWDVDAQIGAKAKEIKLLNEKHQNSSKNFSDEETVKISDIIEKTWQISSELSEKLLTQKNRLNSLADKLQKQESTNLALIQQGLNINQKLKEIIVNAIAPHSKQYNKDGKNVDVDKDMLSFVEKEA